MKLTEYEQKIKDLIKTDKNDPEIYCSLQKMIYLFLLRKRAGDDIRELEEVSFTIAGDLFIKIRDGETINYFLGYLERKYHEYFKEYYRFSRFNEPYDPSYDDSRSSQSEKAEGDLKEVLTKVYLSDIGKVVDNVFEESCKYVYNSAPYINLKVSALLTLIRNGEITDFHLNEFQRNYLRLLVVRLYSEIQLSGKN